MATDDRLAKSVTQIKDLLPGMKNVTCVFIVIDKGTTNHTKDGSVVRKCRVADRSASICFSLWNEQAAAIEAGDILKLTKGYASLWKGSMVLYSGKYGKLEKIGEFTMVYSETPDMSDTNQEFALQQQQRGQPPGGPSSNGSGGRSNDRGTSPGNGRTQPPSTSGNWNGNNHLSDSSSSSSSSSGGGGGGGGPQHQESVSPLIGGHVVTTTHEHIGNGEGQVPYTQQKSSADFPYDNHNYRGPLRHHSQISEHFHPYHHRPPFRHNSDPREGWR